MDAHAPHLIYNAHHTGKVRCWGGNGYGQLGHGMSYSSTGTNLPMHLPDTNLGTSYTASQLSCADFTCCAIVITATSEGMRCWGNGGQGQLGYLTLGKNVGTGLVSDKNLMGDGPSGMPFIQFGGTAAKAVDVSMGGNHGCALMDSGSVMCWGTNTYGQVGSGTSASIVSDPVLVSLNGPAKAVSCYNAVCCVVMLSTLSVKCWYKNTHFLLHQKNRFTENHTGGTAPTAVSEQASSAWARRPTPWARIYHPSILEPLRTRCR